SLNTQVVSLNNQIADLNSRLQAVGPSNSLAVYDALGAKIGDVVGVQDEIPWVSLTAGGQVLVLRGFSGHLTGVSGLFTGAACQGTAYIQDTVFNGANVFTLAGVRDPGGVIYTPSTMPKVVTSFLSVTQSDGSCFTFSSPVTNTLVPATQVMSLDLQFSRP